MIELKKKYAEIYKKYQSLRSQNIPAFDLEMQDVTNPVNAVIGGKTTLVAGSNNYMGITFDAKCLEAASKALHRHGTGTTGSRVANGTYNLHVQLEKELANFLKLRHCIIFTTGYQANLATISGYVTEKDQVFVDIDSHASIYDGCKLSGAQTIIFRHNDVDNLATKLERNKDKPGGKMVILEGLYSMFGDRAPLSDFLELKKHYDFTLLLDDAHSIGVLGKNGRGLADEQGVEGQVDIVVGTFSKSFGSIGGYAASNADDFNLLRFVARPYIFSASQCPSSIASVIEAVRQLAGSSKRRDKLRHNSEKLYQGFKDIGLNLACDVPGPIAAVKIDTPEEAVEKWNAILNAGVYVNIALPPGTPKSTNLLRCSVSAAHDDKDIEQIISTFKQVLC